MAWRQKSIQLIYIQQENMIVPYQKVLLQANVLCRIAMSCEGRFCFAKFLRELVL